MSEENRPQNNMPFEEIIGGMGGAFEEMADIWKEVFHERDDVTAIEGRGSQNTTTKIHVGKDPKNSPKMPTPHPVRGPVSTSVKQSTGYITVKGIQSETSYQEHDWPLFALKELMDNGYDSLNTYYSTNSEEERKIAVWIKIDPIPEVIASTIPQPNQFAPAKVITHIIRIAVRNSNINNHRVFENIEEIFDFNKWYSSKRNQHRMTCGSLGDFLKRVLGMGYATWTNDYNSEDSFESKQWGEPVILRFNNQERKAFIVVEDLSPYAVIKKPVEYDAPNSIEVEVALPLPTYWNNNHQDLLDKLKRFYGIYKLAKRKTGFSFNVIGKGVVVG
jgi:hypothetical protein